LDVEFLEALRDYRAEFAKTAFPYSYVQVPKRLEAAALKIVGGDMRAWQPAEIKQLGGVLIGDYKPPAEQFDALSLWGTVTWRE
jgi:hypothetical protein